MTSSSFWNGKRVFLTGHTGFKGGWLSLWLARRGAEVTGFALDPPTEPNLFALARVGEMVRDLRGDVRDLPAVQRAMTKANPQIVIHMAAQPLVRYSIDAPVETYAVNVMGTVHVLEAARACKDVKAILNVTTDKCYLNRDWVWGYRENEAMGGNDPYSSSKGCSELVTNAYRRTYLSARGVALASARAGNVIGGGDWALDRLVPDIVRSVVRSEAVSIRYPMAVRPWQHVLEPLSGYMTLVERLWDDPAIGADAWNFGPDTESERPVRHLAERICSLWGEGAAWEIASDVHPHEDRYLKLDSSKARNVLGWHPRWSLEQALWNSVLWFKAQAQGEDMRLVSEGQIAAYEEAGLGVDR